MSETFRRVEEHLRPWARGMPITSDTEISHDLGIYGDDLAFDVVLWATREFGVEGVFVGLWDRAPGERNFGYLWRWWKRRRGVKDRRYGSFPVRELVSFIEAKRWPDSK
jgi:hypothetical protein